MPSRLMPLGIKQHIVVGRHDAEWRHHSESYAAASRRADDADVELTVIENAGHFELIAPHSPAWAVALNRIRAVLG